MYNFNRKLKKDLYKRCKKKIYFLTRNYRCNTRRNAHSQGPYNLRFKKIIHLLTNLGSSINKTNNTVQNTNNIPLHSPSSQTAAYNVSRSNSGTSDINLVRDLNVDTSFTDYITKCDISPSICKTINKADGYKPVSNLTPSTHNEQSNDALLVCPWTDAKKLMYVLLYI